MLAKIRSIRDLFLFPPLFSSDNTPSCPATLPDSRNKVGRNAISPGHPGVNSLTEEENGYTIKVFEQPNMDEEESDAIDDLIQEAKGYDIEPLPLSEIGQAGEKAIGDVMLAEKDYDIRPLGRATPLIMSIRSSKDDGTETSAGDKIAENDEGYFNQGGKGYFVQHLDRGPALMEVVDCRGDAASTRTDIRVDGEEVRVNNELCIDPYCVLARQAHTILACGKKDGGCAFCKRGMSCDVGSSKRG